MEQPFDSWDATGLPRYGHNNSRLFAGILPLALSWQIEFRLPEVLK